MAEEQEITRAHVEVIDIFAKLYRAFYSNKEASQYFRLNSPEDKPFVELTSLFDNQIYQCYSKDDIQNSMRDIIGRTDMYNDLLRNAKNTTSKPDEVFTPELFNQLGGNNSPILLNTDNILITNDELKLNCIQAASQKGYEAVYITPINNEYGVSFLGSNKSIQVKPENLLSEIMREGQINEKAYLENKDNKKIFSENEVPKNDLKKAGINWDCIIMTHDQFMKIPQSDHVQRRILMEELTKIDRSLNALNNHNVNFKRAKKTLEMRKKTLTVKLNDLNNKLDARKDDVVDFNTMGIDHIFCDESHKFKNLRVQTRHERVAGIGNTQGSERSMNMKYAIRDIQERKGKDLCATFVSGTTIVNSCTELYVLFDYLRPKALETQAIGCFDAWASIYTRKSKEIEFSVTGELIMKERFREFVKVPELSKFYSEITDYKTAEQIGIERPVKNESLVVLEQTDEQREMFDRLKEFAKTGNGEIIFRPKLSSNEQTAKMLIATNTAKKASIDMRLIDENLYGSTASNRTKELAERAFDYYKKYDDQKCMQFIFSDIGVYKSEDKFSLYNDIKQNLIEKGVPENEIQFIQNFKTDKKRDELIADANAGRVRFPS